MSTVDDLQILLMGDSTVLMPSRSKDEVWPKLWVAECYPAKDPATLNAQGFTHVLNCSQGHGFGRLNTNGDTYSPHGLAFMGISIADSEKSNLLAFFDDATAYIHQSLSNGGTVLVHCMEGFSRSPTIAAAYLIKYQQLTTEKALEHIRSKREVFPNAGFLRQLLEWEKMQRE
eukprot:m.139568 g.139568  ORF g.139568 m.139568 type:complete len:173 (-) comp15951_c0_seq2:1534-2052(-)